jgi:hypothetical protein
MKGLLVRVGIDTSCGFWNCPIDTKSGSFVYVPIPEQKDTPCRNDLERPYFADKTLKEALSQFNLYLPQHLESENMHLDPDFEFLTYGDQGQRAARILKSWKEDKTFFLVFYAGLKPICADEKRLYYAIIGFYQVQTIIPAKEVNPIDWHKNAHTRREPGNSDIVVIGKKEESGRLERAVPILTEFRNRAYRIRKELLEEWGDISVKDGFIQRSAYLPEFKNPERFLNWFDKQGITLIHQNNTP